MGGTAETGMWLGRTARGKGAGTRVLRALLAEAARQGVRAVIAETTADNAAAIGVLRRCGAVLERRSDAVHARIRVGPKPAP